MPKLKVGDTVHVAEMHGWDSPFPKNELDQLRDLDGGIVTRVTRGFVWLDLRNGQKSKVPRKWVCSYRIFGHQSVPCPYCGYGSK